MKFNTQYNFSFTKVPRRPVLPSDSDDLVEIGTYLPKDKKIEAYVLGGRVLEAARSSIEFYDFDEKTTDEEEDSFNDPTRVRGYDMSDAHQEALRLEAKFEADSKVKAKAKAKAEAEAEAKAKADAEELELFRKKAAEVKDGDT